jgi:metal-responsive CopG/Arc/MetJ family transcriptional regulator
VGKTSSAVKNRYNNKAYKTIHVLLSKELVSKWELAIKEDNISKAEFVRNAINDYFAKRAER